MADIKISQMDDGGLVEDGDQIPVARGGANYRVQAGTAASRDSSEFATAEQGVLAENAVQPSDLSAVATSGDYNDLSNKPTLGTAAAQDVGYFATAAQGAKADTAVQPSGLIASAVTATDPNSTGQTTVQGQLNLLTSGFNAMPIGVPFPVRTDLGVSAPSNSGARKFIELTYGKSGAGGYNNGLLVGEVTSGTFPDNLIATGIIVGGIMDGEVIRLKNTMQLFMRGAETGGILQRDAIRNITGQTGQLTGTAGVTTGVLQNSSVGAAPRYGATSGDTRVIAIDASLQVPTAPENRPQNEGAVYFMRII